LKVFWPGTTNAPAPSPAGIPKHVFFVFEAEAREMWTRPTHAFARGKRGFPKLGPPGGRGPPQGRGPGCQRPLTTPPRPWVEGRGVPTILRSRRNRATNRGKRILKGLGALCAHPPGLPAGVGTGGPISPLPAKSSPGGGGKVFGFPRQTMGFPPPPPAGWSRVERRRWNCLWPRKAPLLPKRTSPALPRQTGRAFGPRGGGGPVLVRARRLRARRSRAGPPGCPAPPKARR